MTAEYIALQWWQVAVAAALILINGLISIALQLGLEKRLLVAATRMTIQLILIGYVLNWIFAIDSPLAVAGLGLLMTVIAGRAAASRTQAKFPGKQTAAIVSVAGSGFLVTIIALQVVIAPHPWWHPQYAIPLLGMILGNALTGISLGMERFVAGVQQRRTEIEGSLVLGATRWEAVSPMVVDAVRTGMIPILNTMTVAGIVSLPGMMTGQLLAGAEPLDAVRYQIVIMFLIAAAVAIGTVGAVLLSFRKVTTADHQLLWLEQV